jgi:hypothetical protein
VDLTDSFLARLQVFKWPEFKHGLQLDEKQVSVFVALPCCDPEQSCIAPLVQMRPYVFAKDAELKQVAAEASKPTAVELCLIRSHFSEKLPFQTASEFPNTLNSTGVLLLLDAKKRVTERSLVFLL